MAVAIPEPNQSFGGGGILRVVGNSELDKIAKKEQEKQTAPELTGLAAYVRQAFNAAQNAKESEIEQEMLNAVRARKAEYTPTKLAAIRQIGGSEVYMGLTGAKCVDAEAWIKDVLLPAGDRSWAIKPTPAPDIPEGIKAAILNQVSAEVDSKLGQVPPDLVHIRINQISDGIIEEFDKVAREVADRMDVTIQDQFVEGGFYQALSDVIYDVVTFPAGIIRKGMKVQPTLTWNSNGVSTEAVVNKKIINHWYRVSPFDIYPAPDSSGINDGYLIERHRMRRSTLISLKGTKGFKNEAIDLVLMNFGTSGLTNWLTVDQERADLENKDQQRYTPDRLIDAIEFHGEIPGSMLLQWGMSAKEIKDPLGEYEANVWVIGPYIIKATLNKDPLLRRPYFKASYEDIPGSFWGRGVPKKMEDVQTICNGVSRSLVNNVAISSGPQVEVFTDRIAAGEDITTMHPWKIWQTKADPTGSGHRALNFDQPNINAGELIGVYEFFARMADDHTGIPPFGSGNASSQGAGSRAAAGIAMIMTAAAKGIKQVIKNIDEGIMEPLVERNYQWNMQFNPDETIKGDVKVEAKGASSLVAKEQVQVRRQEFLQSTANEFDFPLMGPEGRSALLREVAKGLDMPLNDVVPKIVRQIGPPIGQIPAEQAQGSPAQTTAAGDKQTDFNTVPNKA